MKRILLAMTIALSTIAPISANSNDTLARDNTGIEKPNDKNIVVLGLKDGPVVIELFENKAPNHVKRIKQLTNDGFYNGVVFHRVIEDFMAQTGDPSGTGMGGSKLPNLKAEFNDISHVRGILSMARSSDPNSANSQFFIVLKDSLFLDGQYTVFGKVISGMEFVDQIKKGDKNNNGMVTNPDKIIKMHLKNTAVM